jgi:hypothetical protein
MLPMKYFADRRFSVGSGVITTSFFMLFGWFFLFGLYLQFARGYSPLEAGLATLPSAATFVLVSPRSAQIAERIGAGRTMSAGFLLVGLGMAAMGLVSVDSQYLVLVLGMVLLSAGMAIVAAPATGSIISAVPLNRAGVASAVNDTTRELGGALGIAVFGSIANSAYRSNIDTGGLDVAASTRTAAEESIGEAIDAVSRDGGGGTQAIIERAASAFTNAFNVTSWVAVAIAVVAAAIVARTFTRTKEQAAIETFDATPFDVEPVPVGASE